MYAFACVRAFLISYLKSRFIYNKLVWSRFYSLRYRNFYFLYPASSPCAVLITTKTKPCAYSRETLIILHHCLCSLLNAPDKNTNLRIHVRDPDQNIPLPAQSCSLLSAPGNICRIESAEHNINFCGVVIWGSSAISLDMQTRHFGLCTENKQIVNYIKMKYHSQKKSNEIIMDV